MNASLELPVLPGTTPVRLDDEARNGPFQQRPLQGAGDQCFANFAHLLAYHVIGVKVLKGTQVGPSGYVPGPVGQRQIHEARSPTPGSPS